MHFRDDAGMQTYFALAQTLTVLVAAGGLFVALRIARDDRRQSAEIARDDRAAMRHEAERRHILDLLVRLVENLDRGGSTDPQERARMGAEAGALTTAIGPDLLPHAWARRHEDIEEARKRHADVERKRDWSDAADEAALALHEVARDPDAGSARST